MSVRPASPEMDFPGIAATAAAYLAMPFTGGSLIGLLVIVFFVRERGHPA